MTTLTFCVFHQPIGKERARTQYTKHGYHTHTPQKTRDYEELVATLAMVAMHRQGIEMFPKQQPLSVSVIAYRDNAYRADIDNICKSVMDGMEGVVYHNDSQVLELYSRLYRKADDAKIEVTVKELEQAA